MVHRRQGRALPSVEAIDQDTADRGPLAAAVNQDIWVLRELGFKADLGVDGDHQPAPTDPLLNYDVIFNTGAYPLVAQAGRG